MKSVIIAIRPQWVEKIANGEKTIEVRKTAPKEVPFKAYIYCTKEKKQDDIIWAGIFGDRGKWNGRVIGEFICNNASELDYVYYWNNGYEFATCLTYRQVADYGKGKTLYGWHISELKIYDKPKELSEFKTPSCEKSEKACGNCKWLVKINTPDVYECECYVEDGRPIKRPPQSWCYVEELQRKEE